MRAVLYNTFQQLPEVVTVDDPACLETVVVLKRGEGPRQG